VHIEFELHVVWIAKDHRGPPREESSSAAAATDAAADRLTVLKLDVIV
jgi:hypothetical protein